MLSIFVVVLAVVLACASVLGLNTVLQWGYRIYRAIETRRFEHWLEQNT